MPVKISRTILALYCIALILLPPLGGSFWQTASVIGSGGVTDTEISEPDAAEQADDSGEPPESDTVPAEDQSTEPPPEPDGEYVQEQNAEPTTEQVEESGGDYAELNEDLAFLYGIEANERVVRTFAELKDALASNNGVTAVHLGADITMQGGINIHDSKSHIVIDGIDPENLEQTEPYTLTDFNSAAFTDTIYISSSGVKNVLVRDLKIVGKNYYGPFSALDSASTAGLTLTFERVDYNGPQIGYHRQGTIRIADCKIRLHGENGICSSQEFSEAKNLVFEGVNTIDTATTAYSVFWHPYGGTFTLADDSSVRLTSPNTSGVYYVFYADGSAYEIDVDIGQRAVFDITIANSVSSTLQATLSGLAVREGGGFYLKTTAATGRAVLSIGGDITVEPDAVFKIESYGKNDYPVLNMTNGDIVVGKDAVFHIISVNTNSSLLNLYGCSLICDDPASVLFSNPGNRVITAVTNPSGIYIDAEQINYWRDFTSGGIDNPPLYGWRKSDGTNIRIDGTLAVNANGNFSGISSNYTGGDLPETAPDAVSFNMVSARVIACGRLELMVNTPAASSSEITGITAPGSDVRVSLNQNGVVYTMPDTVADSYGSFIVPAGVSLLPLIDVTVKSSYRYLTATKTVSVEDMGTLAFTAPGELKFYTAALAPKTQFVKRLSPDWHLMVSDTRGIGSTWSIYANELQPLTPADPSKPALEDSLVFVGETGAVTPLSGGYTLIHRHTTVAGNEMVNISWSPERGILACIPTGAAYAGQSYAGIIEWSLIDAP